MKSLLDLKIKVDEIKKKFDTLFNIYRKTNTEHIQLATFDGYMDVETLSNELINIIDEITEDIGESSDGYHTFNELYKHRAILTMVLFNSYPNLAWKSKYHHDPDFPMYDGMFIVGIETPTGQATYHYDIDPYWDLFRVKELDRAPEWDGHTPEDAINRIATLGLFTGKEWDEK